MSQAPSVHRPRSARHHDCEISVEWAAGCGVGTSHPTGFIPMSVNLPATSDPRIAIRGGD